MQELQSDAATQEEHSLKHREQEELLVKGKEEAKYPMLHLHP
jgi:hypothetical protein